MNSSVVKIRLAQLAVFHFGVRRTLSPSEEFRRWHPASQERGNRAGPFNGFIILARFKILSQLVRRCTAFSKAHAYQPDTNRSIVALVVKLNQLAEVWQGFSPILCVITQVGTAEVRGRMVRVKTNRLRIIFEGLG